MISVRAYIFLYIRAFPTIFVYLLLSVCVFSLIGYWSYGIIHTISGALVSVLMVFALKVLLLTFIHDKIFEFRRRVAVNVALIASALFVAAIISFPVLAIAVDEAI